MNRLFYSMSRQAIANKSFNICLRNLSVSSFLERPRSSASIEDSSLLSMAMNMLRSLEREFENAQNRMTKEFKREMLPPIKSFYSPLLSNKPMSLLSAENKVNRDFDMVTVDEHGNSKFQLVLDLSDFTPEEIKITTKGHTLMISAFKEKQVKRFIFFKL